MEDRKYKVDLYLYDRPLIINPIEFYQNDTESCAIEFNFNTDRVNKFDLTNKTVEVRVTKPDLTTITDSATITGLNTAVWELKLGAISLATSHSVSIYVYQNTERLTFGTLKYKVIADREVGNVGSQPEYPILTELIAEVQGALNESNQTNENISVMEQQRAENENNRNLNEQQRIVNEDNRAITEQQRQQNETTRNSEFNNIKSEYAGIKGIMIDENNAANLQNQVNQVNTQLAEKAKQIDLNNTNANVTLKADKLYVDNQIANVASGSPKGVFSTIAELQTAYPTGTTGTYIVSADGKLYGWINGAWASIVQYQSTGFADKSISKIKTDFFGQGKNYIDFSKTISGYFVNQTTGTFDASASHRRTEKLPCKPNQSYIFGAFSKSTGLYSSSTTLNCAFRYAFYDSNDQYISGTLNTPSFTAPTNAVTIAISWNNSNDASYNFQLEEGTVATTYESYNLQIDESNLKLTNIKNDINTLKLVTTKATNIIFEETFKSSIPSHLTNSGEFTISDGLVSPTTTGYDKQIYYNKEVCLDKEKIYVDFVLTNLSTKIGVGFRSAIAGLLCEVDFVSNKLIIRNAWSDPTLTTPPTVYKELALTFTPVLNRKYSIVVEKDTRKNCSITIKDVLTFENTKLDCVEQLTTSPANAWGGACIVAIAGSFKVTKFIFLNNQPSSSKLAIYGDSFIEGSTIMPNIDQRYASKIKTLLNGSCIIGGKGGDYAYGLLQKINTYGLFRPKYTLLSIGLNDTSFTQYKSSIETLIQWCESIGSIPILTTITRNMSTDNLVFMQQVNNYVRTSGYRYVDFAQVMSLNYDGETQNTSLFLADKIHPNSDGHEKMYQKIIADLPEIFDVA